MSRTGRNQNPNRVAPAPALHLARWMGTYSKQEDVIVRGHRIVLLHQG